MNSVVDYFHWKVRVLTLLMEGSHRTDKGGPVLTSVEQKEMETMYAQRATPEEFVSWLTERDTQAADRVRSTSRVG